MAHIVQKNVQRVKGSGLQMAHHVHAFDICGGTVEALQERHAFRHAATANGYIANFIDAKPKEKRQ